MPRLLSQGEAEGQADHAGSASAPIGHRQACNERQGGYRPLTGRTRITSVCHRRQRLTEVTAEGATATPQVFPNREGYFGKKSGLALSLGAVAAGVRDEEDTRPSPPAPKKRGCTGGRCAVRACDGFRTAASRRAFS